MTPCTGTLAIVAANSPADNSDTAAAMTKRAFTASWFATAFGPSPGALTGR